MNRNEAIDIIRKNWPCDRHQLSEALETLIPELKENEDEGIRKWIKKELESKYVVGNTVNNVMADKAFAWLEKQGKPKAEAITPKFKEGDWIVYKDDYTKEEDVLVVSNPDSKGTSLYTTDGHQKYYLSWESLKKARLWTIEDAKEGDVLVTDNKSVFIYAKILYNKPYAYCGVDKFGVFKDNCLEHDWANSVDNIHPAAKEQCDFLFQKMHEAGYEWDAVKKELKRIEQSPDELPNGEANSEESKSICYRNDGLYYAIDILETTLGKVEGYQSDDGILEHKCAISAVKQLKQLVDFCPVGNSDKSSEKDMTGYNKNFECGKRGIKTS